MKTKWLSIHQTYAHFLDEKRKIYKILKILFFDPMLTQEETVEIKMK